MSAKQKIDDETLAGESVKRIQTSCDEEKMEEGIMINDRKEKLEKEIG